MKFKIQSFISVLLSAVLLAVSLSACTYVPTVEILPGGDYEGDHFINPDTGVEYISCNLAVSPFKQGDLYCKYTDQQRYRQIKFQDPLEFICDDDELVSYVYRAVGMEDITMKNFNPVGALLYLEGEIELFADQFYAEGKYLNESAQAVIEEASRTGEDYPYRDDSEYTYAIRDAINNTEPQDIYPYDYVIDTDYTVHIQLMSDDYPGLLYLVVFYRDLEGNNYLFDYGTKLSYKCPDNVAERLWWFLA